MSILKSIIDSVRSSFSNEAFDQIQVRGLQSKVVEAIKEASSDGTITADEVAEIKELTNKLELSDEEFAHIKLEVMQNLIAQILEDNKVTDDEMNLLKEVEDSLKFAEEDQAQISADIEKVKALYEKNK